MRIVLCFIFFFTGICFGSFSLCYSQRYVNRETMMTRSKCDKCHHVLSWCDLLPLVSYLVNKGRCRYCGERITVLCFVYELLSGIMLLGLLAIKGVSWDALMLFSVFELSLVISYTDLMIFEIPDSCIVMFIIIRMIKCENCLDTLMNGSLMASYIYALSLLMNFIYKRQMIGMGDIKLLFVSGIYLGFYKSLLCLLAACAFALIYVLISKRRMIPFGPFICFSMFTFLLLSKMTLL